MSIKEYHYEEDFPLCFIKPTKKSKPFGLGRFRNNVLFVCYSIFSKPDYIITKKKALSIEPCDNGMQPVFFECPFQDRHSGLAFFFFSGNVFQ